MSLFLAGFQGCGKTHCGRAVAAMLQLPFRDVDEELLQQAGRTIRGLYSTLGEARFRALECKAVQRLAGQPPAIVALGGGSLMAMGDGVLPRHTLVYLALPQAVLEERLQTLPPYAPTIEAWRQLYANRHAQFMRCCQHTVDAQASDVVAQIAALWHTNNHGIQ